ncbi:hypothetical protein ROZALSC1DRAFT_30305 [Rozella allomycis CSF55]|uniref:RING-type domain-containing protein n=1 Tax=Rozella allomycis (strain CSF55) TaxID=988480 RepID=A0A075AV53_ROZAC|nr:hypothetical protein O9G_001341 [Rozella allomycis CSF55]RKP17943.1 hypothetical protein ROZALSC1DRAFT_30305 [Rozella allomycis CSF55]|eukprot:EPZ32439.1 hypothetical protein O9G_001341 [Rozella allomycis CSF55]
MDQKDFYCHECNRTFQNQSPSCTSCNSSFVEEVEDDTYDHLDQNANSGNEELDRQVDNISALLDIPLIQRATARGGGIAPFSAGVLAGDTFLSFFNQLFGGSEVIGNFGDYVFSQNALDQVITRLMEQQGNRNAPPPANIDIISNLPTFKFLKNETKDDENECSVCKEMFQDGEMIKKIPNCSHIFHADCLDPWLKLHGTCPVCRFEVFKLNNSNESPIREEDNQPEPEQVD